MVGANSGNSYNIKNSGPCCVHFLDTDQKIKFQLPDVIMSGILFGTMQLYLSKSMILHDKENHLKGHITFDNSTYTDRIQGSIYKYDPAKLQLDTSNHVTKLKDISYELCIIRGNWQSLVTFDDTVVWNIDDVRMSADASAREGRGTIK